MRGNVVWTVVVDGGRLRVLERPVERAPWHELEAEAVQHRDPPSHELGTERPGRVHESADSARHAIEPRQDLHKAREAAFAREVAQRLEHAAAAGRYDRLVLIAPPTFLGQLRPALGDQARRRLAGTLDLDLTHAAVADIAEHLVAQGLPEP